MLCVSRLAADNWPTYQHDNQRTGVTAEAITPPLNVQWRHTPPAAPAKGWPLPANGYGVIKDKNDVNFDDAFQVVSVGSMAYFCSTADNQLYAVDAASGMVKWTFFTGAPPRLAPVLWKGKVIVGGDDSVVYCLDGQTGALQWKVDCAPADERMLGHGRFSSVWAIRAGGMIENDIFYCVAGLFPAEGIFFYAINPADGAMLWRRQLDKGGSHSPSPQGYMLASDDSIYMTAKTAPTRWSKADWSPLGFATPFPAVKNPHEYGFYNGGSEARIWNGKNVVYGQACVLAYDPDKVFKDKYGHEQKGELIFNWFNARQMLFNNGTAYAATDYYLAAVDEKLLPELAKSEFKEFEEAYKGLTVASFLEHQSTYKSIAGKYGEEHPLCVWIKNGPFKWGADKWSKWPAKSEELIKKCGAKAKWLTPLVANQFMIKTGEVIYAGGEDAVVAIDGATGKELWRTPTASRVRGLSAANGRLYVSEVNGTVSCLAAAPCASPAATVADLKAAAFTDDGKAEKRKELAKQIVAAASASSKGYCLLLGGDGRLAAELAGTTKLDIYLALFDEKSVGAARRALAAAGVYGSRVTVDLVAKDKLPYPPYVFNLVVDEDSLNGGEQVVPITEALRVTRPCGGVLVAGKSAGAVDAVLASCKVELDHAGGLMTITRGALPGAKDWTHNYGTAAGTFCNEDALVKPPFGILWYGEPGPRKRIERHASPPLPLVVDGVFYTIGYDIVMAYDAYNGLLYWERLIMGASRERVGLDSSNIVTDGAHLYLVVGEKECQRLDLKTGETTKTYPVPLKEGSAFNFWSWISLDNGLLFGSRSEVDEKRKQPTRRTSATVFAMDPESGERKWVYEGAGIDHDGIAIGDGKLFLVDRNLSDAEKTAALAATVKDPATKDREPIDKQGKPLLSDLRKIVVLEEKTGKILWQKPFNVSDVTIDDTVISAGNVTVVCMYKDKTLILCGTGSFGHPYKEYEKGEFARRAIYAFASDDGALLWGGRRNYHKRPIIVGDCVYAEPFVWHLRTGKPKTVENPLSGGRQQFDIYRGYIGCSHLLASGAALFGSWGNGISGMDLDKEVGFMPFSNMSVSCGLCMCPADGIFLAPEGRSGCMCPTPILSSIALYPKEKGRAWATGLNSFLKDVVSTPVRHAYLNLGASGYQEDAEKHLWIPYSGDPVRFGTGLIGKWLPAYAHNESQFYQLSEAFTTIGKTDRPWLYTCGYKAEKPLSFKMFDKGQGPGTYTVRLHFAEPDAKTAAGRRVFSVLLQGKEELKDFDIVKAVGAPLTAVMREVKGVQVVDNLTIQLRPAASSPLKEPILCAVEAVRE